MAVVGVPGWIGASVVAETGERWMGTAGGVLLNKTSGFWMSEFAGKSKSFNMTIGRSVWTTPLAGNQTNLGCGFNGTGGRIGSITSNTVWNGVTDIVATKNSVSTSGQLIGPNLPARNLILNIAGTNFTFTYQLISGTPWFTPADPNGLFNFLNARVNQTVVCTPQN